MNSNFKTNSLNFAKCRVDRDCKCQNKRSSALFALLVRCWVLWCSKFKTKIMWTRCCLDRSEDDRVCVDFELERWLTNLIDTGFDRLLCRNASLVESILHVRTIYAMVIEHVDSQNRLVKTKIKRRVWMQSESTTLVARSAVLREWMQRMEAKMVEKENKQIEL